MKVSVYRNLKEFADYLYRNKEQGIIKWCSFNR